MEANPMTTQSHECTACGALLAKGVHYHVDCPAQAAPTQPEEQTGGVEHEHTWRVRGFEPGTINCICGIEVEVNALLAQAEAKGEARGRVAELEYIQTHASGGGSWRRLIIQRLAQLTGTQGK